ncbi:MAG: 2-oxoglutarate dehydrogenase E1 component [Alphaproteobacteria bacterium]|nr:2-oxoglutarate dehydrogenase E1 component [Alphaproteobacteria bacterium]
MNVFQLESTMFLSGASSAFIEELYLRYLKDPSTVDGSWRAYFAELGDVAPEKVAPWGRPLPVPEAEEERRAKAGAALPTDPEAARRQASDSIKALQLIRAYRARGHLLANLDPLGIENSRSFYPELDPAAIGFTEEDWDRPIYLGGVLGLDTANVRQIMNVLRTTYCGTIGVEFTHISDPKARMWIQTHFEAEKSTVVFTPEGKRAILRKLIEAEGFEKYLSVKFVGTKRFGLDGGESLIPAIEAIIKRGGQLGVREIVIGMPHRGRLNILANVMAKPYRAMFNEFQGGTYHPEDVQGSGDVKYHLGTSSDREFDGNKVHLSLTPNPSHLEAVNAVVLGKARAKQFQLGDMERTQVLPLIFHGDAAFAGQGIVPECFGLSELKGYRTGGTIHFVVNNQIGFTTSPQYSRSSPYPTDSAKMVQTPIFHVNGDDPEAVTHVCKLATEYRQTFKKDVVIDMFCYRRHGHNESDEPAFTQPKMYREIAKHPTTVTVYARRLIEEKTISEGEFKDMWRDYNTRCDQEFEASKGYKANKADWFEGRWTGLRQASDDDRRGKSGAPMKLLKDVGMGLVRYPEKFNIHKTIARQLETKRKMIETGEGLDWATAEALAFGTLLMEDYPIRLSGQDSGRGTFSQRHSVLVDQVDETRFLPLNNLKPEQKTFYEVIDSMLSENAVLGFEYGYSTAEPNALVLWEGQFGDFANGAQVFFDQFLASAESKWLRMSGLVVLLPHGMEGQGPEHSSARLERYLQLSAEDNWQVLMPTTPANYFHLLRRQIHREFRKPAIVMTPKSLLRHKRCVSRLDELGPETSFHRMLWDDMEVEGGKIQPAKIKRVVLCSGKVYFDLYEEREKRGVKDVYLLRVEQLYPFPLKALMTELKRFAKAEVVWCQEEPQNMGAWTFVDPYIEAVLGRLKHVTRRARYVGRPASASPATGNHHTHVREQAKLVDEALTV